MRTDAVCRTPLAGSAHAFCAQRKRRRGRTASCRCALTGVYGQFARVAKGVDLTSTAGNCAWARAPQLTRCALLCAPVVWRKLFKLCRPPGSLCIDLSMPRLCLFSGAFPASAGSSSKDLVGCAYPAGMACARRSGTLPCCIPIDAVCRTPPAGSAHAFCAQCTTRRGRTASYRCALSCVYGQFARVAQGVDLRSTAGNCAWA